ncbi:MAG: nucleotide disphospho-sugar-binding domain-containing protein [Rhodothermales bacterium]
MEASRSYLYVTWEGGGNVAPVLGSARRLASRGHRVTVLTEPCLRQPVEEIGARFVPFTQHFTRTDRTEDLVRDSEAKSPLGRLERAFDNLMFGPSRIVAEETLATIRERSPDVLVVDLNMVGALLAGEAAGLPRVVLFHMPEYLPGPGRPAAGPGFLPREDWIGHLRDGLFIRMFYGRLDKRVDVFNEARRAVGLAPISSGKEILDVYHEADLRLIQTCEAFDFPITPAPENVRYVGPVLDDPDWTSGTWNDPWPDGDERPLVVVSVSSTPQNQHGVLQRTITALGRLEVRGLVTLGPAMSGETFDVPPNVVTMPSVPHTQVFPHADAVVTHAGHGTVMRALAHGLPLVCLPMGRDQNDNAARVLTKGVGLRLKPSAKPGRIRSAVHRVLEEPSFRASARRLQRVITKDAAADRATQELERVGRAGVAVIG